MRTHSFNYCIERVCFYETQRISALIAQDDAWRKTATTLKRVWEEEAHRAFNVEFKHTPYHRYEVLSWVSL